MNEGEKEKQERMEKEKTEERENEYVVEKVKFTFEKCKKLATNRSVHRQSQRQAIQCEQSTAF